MGKWVEGRRQVIEVSGAPIPLARPRFGNGRVYDSQVEEKMRYGYEIRKQLVFKSEGYIRLGLEFGFEIKGISKKRLMEKVGSPKGTRPDLSNLVKFVEDAALGILYEDDSIVVEIVASKFWMIRPITIITVTELLWQ